MKRHVEILPARKYYQKENPGHYSKGSVILINGRCEFHGTTKEARSFFKMLTQPMYGPDVIRAVTGLIREAKKRNISVAELIEEVTKGKK